MSGSSLCRLVVAGMVWSLLPGLAQTPSDAPLTVRGKVQVGSGAPIAEAWVRLLPIEGGREGNAVARASSTKAGAFQLQSSAAGRYHLLIEARGRLSVRICLELLANKREVDVGIIALDPDCSSPYVQCDDFGLSESLRPKQKPK